MYQPPTIKARPYGFALDKTTGYIWFADFSGNNITRFDPKKAEFVEYPIPSRGTYARFIGLDSKGRVWFTEFWSGKIGMLDPTGSGQTASR